MGERCTAPRILVNASIDMSANLLNFAASMSTSFLQIMRKKSPLFLLAYPWNSSTTPCTISAIWFTKVITFACSTSVAVLKSRMRAAPIMHSTRFPSIMASTQALSTPCMLCSMIWAPACPNPRARRDPSLMIVFSRITVSISSGVLCLLLHRRISFTAFDMEAFASNFLVFARFISSILNSSSATFIAESGLSRMVSTFAIMFSTGVKTNRFASFENIKEAAHNEIQT
mmetsp:Transcript_95540/g.247409  ORF Transcript_95540/g.247409 Transcript_95540/m.247409 type:complete len:229 (+) Transcript_95540:1214-1900(+)